MDPITAAAIAIDIPKVKTIVEGIKILADLAAQYGIAVKVQRDPKCPTSYFQILDEKIFSQQIPPSLDSPPSAIIVLDSYEHRSKSCALYKLAHEFGHAIVYLNSPKDLLPQRDRGILRLEEEFEAWKVADILLHKLNRKFAGKHYVRHKQKCLKSYYLD